MQKQCIICNKTFFKSSTKSKIEWEKMKFCSQKCYWISPHKKIITVDKICLECKQPFFRKTKESVRQWEKKKYCSFHCSGKATLRGHKVWNKGIKLSTERAYKCGNGMRGKRHNPITIAIMKEKALRGEKSPVWIKERDKLKRSGQSNQDRRSSSYVTWRKNIFERDNWKCKMSNEDCFGRITAHHILSYTNYPEFRFDFANGITLCKKHHPIKRKLAIKLIPFFQNIIS